MTERTGDSPVIDERTLVLTRTFNAPRELVFKAWTSAEHLKHWWGPKGWTLPVCNVDFRVGGVWHYCMRGPNGEDAWGKAVYREITPPERIVYSDSFSDEAGNAVEGMPQMLIAVEFTEEAGGTKVTSRVEFTSAEDLESVLAMGLVQGLNETWDRLESYLATMV